MVVLYDHTVQEHHFVSSGTLMASTCDLKGTKIGETRSAVGPGGVRGLKPFKLETGENQLLVV